MDRISPVRRYNASYSPTTKYKLIELLTSMYPDDRKLFSKMPFKQLYAIYKRRQGCSYKHNGSNKLYSDI